MIPQVPILLQGGFICRPFGIGCQFLSWQKSRTLSVLQGLKIYVNKPDFQQEGSHHSIHDTFLMGSTYSGKASWSRRWHLSGQRMLPYEHRIRML